MEAKDPNNQEPVEYEAERSTLSLPTMNLYIEMILWKMFNGISNSVGIFLDIIFEEKSIQEIYDHELIEGTSSGCPMEILKEYYQQFCYWNLFEEEDLDSPTNITKLLRKGYKVVDTEEEILILKKILLKKNISVQSVPDMNVNDYKSSLHAFIELMCVQTNYDSDEVPQSLFNNNYEMFCNLFEVNKINLDLAMLKKEFHIDHSKKKVNMLERTNKPSDLNPKNMHKYSKFYKLNLSNISDYLSLLKGSTVQDKVTPAEQSNLIKKLIFPKGWFIMDVMMCITIYLVIYVLFFFYQNQAEESVIMLSNFKKIPEPQRVRSFNTATVDGNLSLDSPFNPEGLVLMQALRIILVYTFLGISMLALILGKDISNYFSTSHNQFTNISNDILAVLQWGLFFLSLFIFMYSVSLYLVSTIIYALIKIYALLPYVVSSLCLVAYIWYFTHNASKTSLFLQERVKADLKTLLVSRYVERLHHASSHHSEMLKLEQLREKSNQSSIQGTFEPLGEVEVQQTISQVMGELNEVCMLKDPWIKFIESVLLEDKQKIQSSLINIVEVPPISLPVGSLELLSQILAIDENMENPELFISIISSILLKIMMTNDRAFLKDLKLKELEILKTCECPDDELLDKNLVCRNCRRTDLYAKNEEEIFKLTLEKNTYIFLLLISMMDLIRKKNTSKILDILIDKILPEGVSGEEKDTTACLMKFAYQAFFDIDQNFNRLDWAKCINDIMMNFFPTEQNSIHIINLLEESHNDNAFDVAMYPIDSNDTINSVKRCITKKQFIVKQTNSISHFLSLAAILIGKESSIPDKLLKDIHQFVNKNANTPISEDTLKILFNYILFSRETPRSIFNKISLNAQKYFLDPEITATIKEIKSIASGISNEIKTKDYQNLESSTIVQQIRKMMNLQPYEMMGFIYLINDKADNDEVSKFFHHIFTINNFQKYERTLQDLIDLAVSRDFLKISRTFDRLKLKYNRIFAYLRGIIGSDKYVEKSNKELLGIVHELPVESGFYPDAYEQLVRGLNKKDLSQFFQSIAPKSESSGEVNIDNPKWRNFKMLELVWFLNSEEKLTDVLLKSKALFRELDDPMFFSFSMKIYTVLEYILKRKKHMMDSTIAKSRAVKIFADIIFTKVENVQKLIDLFVTEKTDDFIEAFCYFNESCRTIVENNGRSLRNHIQYIDKSINFLKAQIDFYSSNPIDAQNVLRQANTGYREVRLPTTDELGVIIIKKIMMPEIKLKHNQIMVLLENIIRKIFNNEDQIGNKSVRIMKFFAALFLYVLGDHNSDLGDYFEKEHKEGFIKTLINCRGSKSSTQRMNILFDDLYHSRKDLFGISLYVYLILLLKGKLARDEFNLREQFEDTLCKDWKVHPELFAFLDVMINRNKFKFKSMLMSVHWKILKQYSSHNSLKKEDVDWDNLYENILSVLADKTPNLSFFSDLLKVPLSKLNFVYIFNNLRSSSKVDKVLQEANSSSSFKEIVESINLDHTELIQILKICLNKAGFECLDTLLKKMKLNDTDQIDINMLMCLITIDSQLMIDPDETRYLFKRMNLYSKLFKKMKVDKDLAWALIRIVKGDMYSFKKFIAVADLDNPSNHKKFLNLVVALCGCKNSPYNTFGNDVNQPVAEIVQKYNELAADSRKMKENTREAAQIMLWELLGVHPVWGLIESEMGKKVSFSTRVIPLNRVLNLKGPSNPLKMFQFYIMYSILNVNLLGLELFVNLSFFHSVNKALGSLRVADNEEAQTSLAELQAYYKTIFENVKLMFRKTMLEKPERNIVNFEYSKTISDYWIFIDLAQESGDEMMNTFYETINTVLINHWKQSYSRKHEIGKQEEEEFATLLANFKNRNIMSAFAHASGSLPSECVIHDEAKFESFLDSVVDCILVKMNEMNSVFHSPCNLAEEVNRELFDEGSISCDDIFEHALDMSQEEDADEQDEERMNITTGNQGNTDSRRNDLENEQGYESPPQEFKEEDGEEGPRQKFTTDGIIEYCLYIYLQKLRKNSFNNYEEKIGESKSDFNRIDNLFSTVEKLSVFNKNFTGFRKRKYMTLFSYSQGTILGTNKNLKQRYSLHAPELTLYSSLMAEKYEKVKIIGDFEYNFDKKEFLGKLHTIKRILDYDLFNMSFYSPFTCTSFYNRQNKFAQRFYPKDVLPRTEPLDTDYYFSPCLMATPLVKKEEWSKLLAANDQDQMNLYLVVMSNIKNSYSLISFYMIKKGMFRFTDDPLVWDLQEGRLVRRTPKELVDQKTLATKIDKLIELYFSKTSYMNAYKSMDSQNPSKTDFERNQEKIAEYCFFLNDLAQGNYKVLSETRNIFSNNVHYSKYQKIYEAILRLHHLSKKYDHKNLQESLSVLAPHLTSDKNKLFIIVDYIMNTRESSSASVNIAAIGKDLDFQNNQISELLFLFNKNKKTIVNWVESFLKEMALDKDYINIVMTLLRMYLRLIGERSTSLCSNDEFKTVVAFLMNIEQKASSSKHRLMNEIFDVIEQNFGSKDHNAFLEIFLIMKDLAKHRELDKFKETEVEVVFTLCEEVLEKNFFLLNDVTDEVEDILKRFFSVNNTNLLNIFKLVEWLVSKKDNTTSGDIEKYFFEFLNYGNFDLMDLNIEKLKVVLIFLKDFNRANVEGILQFLRDLQLTREYVYIFSRYIWISTLNDNFEEEKLNDAKLSGSIAVLIWFLFLEIILYEIDFHQPSLRGIGEEIRNLQQRLITSISKIPYEKVITVVDQNFDKYSPQKLLSLLKGDCFKPFIEFASDKLMNYKDLLRKSSDFRMIMQRLTNLFFFSITFFNEGEIVGGGSQNMIDALIDYDINAYISLMEYQCKNQSGIDDIFKSQKQFDKHKLDEFVGNVFDQNKFKPLTFHKINYRSQEMGETKLINAGKFLWLIKYYVLHVRKNYRNKLEEIKSQYSKILICYLESYLDHVFSQRELVDDKRKVTKVGFTENTTRFGASKTGISKLGTTRNEDMQPLRSFSKMDRKDKYCKMVTRMVHLFLDMKFKKNYKNVFHDLIDFLTKDVFRSNEKDERLAEFVKKINVESFFELYDNIYENKNIFNRNTENIMRLSLNTLKGFNLKNLSKSAMSLLRVCRGSINDLEDLIKDTFVRTDQVAYAMNQIRWCDNFIKSNTQRKRISEHRKVNFRIKNSGNTRFLNDMSSADQIVFINNLRSKSSLFFEVIPYFEGHLASDSSFYSKYDVYKLLKRMGFEMSIHRLNEILTSSTEKRRSLMGIAASSSPNFLTREEVKNCLLIIEKRIISRVIEMKQASLHSMLFLGIVSTTIAYFTIRVYMVFLKNLWVFGDSYTSFLSCIPIVGKSP